MPISDPGALGPSAQPPVNTTVARKTAAIIRHRSIFIRVFQSSSCRVFFKFPIDTTSPKKRLGLEAGRRRIRDEDVGQRSERAKVSSLARPVIGTAAKRRSTQAAPRSHSNVKAKRVGCHHATWSSPPAQPFWISLRFKTRARARNLSQAIWKRFCERSRIGIKDR